MCKDFLSLFYQLRRRNETTHTNHSSSPQSNLFVHSRALLLHDVTD